MGIIVVDKIKLLKQFISFPNKLYNKDANYVIEKNKVLLSKLKADVLKYKTLKCLLYEKNNVIIARIGYYYGIYENEKVCFFCYLDFVNNDKIVQELFDFIKDDMHINEVIKLVGPLANDNLDNNGILVQGFDFPPSVFSSYNQDYYANVMEKLNFIKKKDYMDLKINPKMIRKKDISNTMMTINRRYNFKICKASDFKNKKDIFERLYYESINHSRASLQYNNSFNKIIDYDNVLIAIEKETQDPIACIVSVPNHNEKNTKDVKIIKKYGLLKKHSKSIKIIDLHIESKYYNTDIGLYLCAKLLEMLQDENITDVAIGKIDEYDSYNIRIYRRLGAEISHVYRLYEKSI